MQEPGHVLDQFGACGSRRETRVGFHPADGFADFRRRALLERRVQLRFFQDGAQLHQLDPVDGVLADHHLPCGEPQEDIGVGDLEHVAVDEIAVLQVNAMKPRLHPRDFLGAEGACGRGEEQHGGDPGAPAGKSVH